MGSRIVFWHLLLAAFLGVVAHRWVDVGLRLYGGSTYAGTPHFAVREMLALAGVRPGEVVADLGCGDGRVVIAAVRDFGAAAVCIERDEALLEQARANAAAAGVEKAIVFELADFFQSDLRGVSVVTLYLLPELNVQLRPKLLAELSPGARVVSYTHDMGAWRADLATSVAADVGTRPIYLWRVR